MRYRGAVVHTICALLFPLVVDAQDIITTVAGGGPNNMPAVSANIAQPVSVATHSLGDFFIVTRFGDRVFRVDSAGQLTVAAGNGTTGFDGDGGSALDASLRFPSGVAVDAAGDLFIADTFNHRIRRVDAATGLVSTVAGSGFFGFGGDGGPATGARLHSPNGVAVDAVGNLLIADTGNHRIRRVGAATGIITTVAGNGLPLYRGDGGPATSASLQSPRWVAVDFAGNLFIADTDNHCIRRVDAATGIITTVAGNGLPTFGGDGGPATGASLHFPSGVAVDAAGNLFIADTNNARIRLVDATTGIITTLAGNGIFDFGGDGGPATSASLRFPSGVAVNPAGDVLIADTLNHRIRRVDGATGIIATEAGNGEGGFSGDGGPATDASLNVFPQGAAVDAASDLFIADTNNARIRRVEAATGIITTVAGNGQVGFSGDGGPATSASLRFPSGVTVDPAGNLFIADTFNQRIRRVAATTGIITTVAGNGEQGFSGDDGPATEASLSRAVGVAVDAVSNLFIADTDNHRIRRVDSRTGIITTVVGNGDQGFSGDGGPATEASLNSPRKVVVDAFGNLFIADTFDNRIRRVDAATGIITTVAGDGRYGFSGDGDLAIDSALGEPRGLALDATGNLFIADTDNHRIRRVEAATGIITTVAGNGVFGLSGDGGPATAARLNFPGGVVVDSNGNLFVTDTNNHRIRRIGVELAAPPRR